MFLGIDCSGVAASLCLLGSDNHEFYQHSDTPRQADVIFSLLEKLFQDAGITQHDLTAIGVITGPGSFTGIRVGLSLAQGLADGLQIPVYGLDGFSALRGKTENALVVLESKRPELYVQHGTDAPQMLLPDEILHYTGNGEMALLHNLIPPHPLASMLRGQTGNTMAMIAARHALQKFQANSLPEPLNPF